MDQKILRHAAFFLYLLYAIYGFVLFTLYQIFANDAVLFATFWLDLFDLLLWWSEPLTFSLMLGYLIYGIYRYGANNLKGLYLVCGSAFLFKYIAVCISDSLLMGSLDLTDDLLSTAISFLTEILIATISVWVSHIWITRKQAENKMASHAAKIAKVDFDENADLFPFQKIFSLHNVLQKSIFFSTALLTAIRLINFIIDDVSYGMYAIADIPFTLIYATLYILAPAVVGYFVTFCTLRALCRKPTPEKI